MHVKCAVIFDRNVGEQGVDGWGGGRGAGGVAGLQREGRRPWERWCGSGRKGRGI